MTNRAPAAIRLVALDLDGVVYRGGQVLPGVQEALEDVLRRGIDLRYVSNNSTAHRETVSERLTAMGLPAGTERILTSGYVTGQWLRARLPPGAPVLVLGERGLMREVGEAGFDARYAGEAPLPAPVRPAANKDPAIPAAVVVGADRAFSFPALAAAQSAVLEGALFVATNLDPTFPTPEGLIPGAGALVAAVATAAGSQPVLMGKPSLALAETLAAATKIPSFETLFVGDRLDTDIAMGRAAGMVTVLVLTGVTGEDDLRRARAQAEPDRTDDAALPDHVLGGLAELPSLLDELGT